MTFHIALTYDRPVGAAASAGFWHSWEGGTVTLEQASPAVRIIDPRTDDDSGLIATGHAVPRLSWRLEADVEGVLQTGYEIEVAVDPDFSRDVARSGLIEETRPYLAPWPAAPLNSREVRWWRVRVRTNLGWTAWCEAQRVEATLLTRADWTARPISPLSNVGRREAGPAPLVRRGFHLDGAPVKARLYVTALGLHDVQINGRPIGPDLFDPGWTVYSKRLLFAAYDVTDLLLPGANVISGVIGDGWFRGDLTEFLFRNIYGDTTALLAQLEVELADGSRVRVDTDQDWKGGYGGLRAAEIYHGAVFDMTQEPAGWRLPGFDDAVWEDVAVLDLPQGLEARDMPGVRVIASWPLAVPEHGGDAGGVVRLDTGQNLSGHLAIRARGPHGAKVTVRHAELLDDAGELYVAPLRHARAEDDYVLDGQGTVELRPSFTWHGFRHAEIGISPGVVIESVTVEAVASDLRPTGSFTCSEPALNRLFDNVVWSQRSNFLSIPTDCPQRDERLGWSGDIQVFTPTACLNADSRAFLRSWLADLALEQREDGAVPVAAPNLLGRDARAWGVAGWGDAAATMPWDIYCAYGDVEAVARQYSSMTAWVDWCVGRLNEDGVWSGDFQLGDWLDPDAPVDKPHLSKTDSGLAATAYLAHSAGRVADAATLLGRREDAARYRDLQTRTRAAAWARWGDEARTTPTGCALALTFELAPQDQRAAAGLRLAELVAANGYRIGTGFLGTPIILSALQAAGQTETAYRLLLNRDCPGWLYTVERGGTTMWERWDAIRPNGSLNIGELSTGSAMVSFNHYAYGAVAAWLYSSVAGVSLDLSRPPETQITIAPEPGGGLTHSYAELETPYGLVAVEWRENEGGWICDVRIPAGAQAQFWMPYSHDHRSNVHPRRLRSGRHRFCVRNGS